MIIKEKHSLPDILYKNSDHTTNFTDDYLKLGVVVAETEPHHIFSIQTDSLRSSFKSFGKNPTAFACL